MRLFIAIMFPDNIKAALGDCISQLQSQGISGNFTCMENMHLTIAFIGETNKVGALKKIIDETEFSPFDISLKGSGCFRDLFWIGIKESSALKAVAADLRDRLADNGFDIESRSFKPHITLARQISHMPDRVIKPFPAVMTVEKLSLMKSQRISGKLVYTEIF